MQHLNITCRAGNSIHLYFYSFRVSHATRFQIEAEPDTIVLLLSRQGTFMHVWNEQPRLLAKTLADIFYNPENRVTLEFPGTGTYSAWLMQIPYTALQSFQSLNAPLQFLLNQAIRHEGLCLNPRPFVMPLEERILLEDVQSLAPVPEDFVENVCLMIFVRALEKLIRQGLLFSDGSMPGYDQENLERAAAELTADPGRRISIAGLAKRNQLSPSRFKILFKQQFGLSVHHFITRIRMDRATDLIRHTNLSIRDIAGEIGYARDSTFSAFYKKKKGINPSDLRKRKDGG